MASVKKLLDEGIENLEKGVKQQVTATVKAVGQQAGVPQHGQNQTPPQQSGGEDSGTNESGQQQQPTDPHTDQANKAATEDVVKSLYGRSNPDEQHGLAPETDAEGKKLSETVKTKMDEGMSPEEAVKYESLRKKLHDETYYIPLTQRKPQEEENKEEEKVEKEEKMEELQVEDKKKKQDDDIAVQQSQQKTEKYPGASG